MAQAIAMILCDTNILVELYKNTPLIIEELRYIGLQELAISTITKAGLYFGALNKRELDKMRKHLALLSHFPIDIIVSDTFLRLMESYSLSHKLSLPDALIAATSLVHNVKLYTLNTKDFDLCN